MRRVVITGLGVISPIGIRIENFWPALISGKSGIAPATSFDTSDFKVHNVAEVKGFNPQDFLSNELIKQFGRAAQYASFCAKLAIEDAKINLSQLNTSCVGVALGTTMGEAQVFEQLVEKTVHNKLDSSSKELIMKYPPEIIPFAVANCLDISGPNTIFPTACSAGNYAITYGFDCIRESKADVMLCGGVDVISAIAFTGFARMLSIASDTCRPFDKNRKGIIVGEGCGMLVLEDFDHAIKRNANIYAEVLGYGLSCDANHMTMPHPQGLGAAIAMKKCLANSGLKLEDVGYISTHGTGTGANDKAETLAIKDVFGKRAYNIPISSIKSMLGHTMGAASSIEAVSCCLSIRDKIIPPTINYETPDPDCDLDCVPNTARKIGVKTILSNSFAFGGNNACVAFSELKNA